jgi:hypothetical protein
MHVGNGGLDAGCAKGKHGRHGVCADEDERREEGGYKKLGARTVPNSHRLVTPRDVSEKWRGAKGLSAKKWSIPTNTAEDEASNLCEPVSNALESTMESTRREGPSCRGPYRTADGGRRTHHRGHSGTHGVGHMQAGEVEVAGLGGRETGGTCTGGGEQGTARGVDSSSGQGSPVDITHDFHS